MIVFEEYDDRSYLQRYSLPYSSLTRSWSILVKMDHTRVKESLTRTFSLACLLRLLSCLISIVCFYGLSLMSLAPSPAGMVVGSFGSRLELLKSTL